MDEERIQDLAELGRNEDSGFVTELVSIFVADSARRLEDLRHAMAWRDAVVLEMTAHTLGDSCFLAGARRATELCRSLAAQSRSDTLDGAPALLAELAHELRGAARELEAWLVAGDGGSRTGT